MTAIEKFLERIDRANSATDPFPADRVINSVDFLRQLGKEVGELVACSIVLSDLYDAEVKRRSDDAVGVFDRKGEKTN